MFANLLVDAIEEVLDHFLGKAFDHRTQILVGMIEHNRFFRIKVLPCCDLLVVEVRHDEKSFLATHLAVGALENDG